MLARIFVEKKDTASIYQLNLDETLLNLNSDHFGIEIEERQARLPHCEVVGVTPFYWHGAFIFLDDD